MSEQSIFNTALDLTNPAERAAYLTAACAGDDALRRRVLALLRSHEEAGSFLMSPIPAPEYPAGSESESEATIDGTPRSDFGSFADRRPSHDQAVSEQPGSVIGRYKLLQQIGEGGFGVVYMADQEAPVKRRVALKIIKAGMDTRGVIARFEAERQALAMMDHPNIARVLDAGATAAGRPYFVMELVKGIPITDYCDQANLDMRARLELFMDVCKAVQHAHQKGVIHRDLKPSNIMVTLHDAKPVVKVIDFGIAKATEQKLTEKTLFTNFGQMIGTPAYMSPEQAVMSGLDVDTRSDIYSLGVLLYELLTGSPPFDAKTLRNAGFDEMRRIIREQRPQKPSTRLSTLAEDVKLTLATQRQVSPQTLRKQLHGDLDWIVLKALEKDRTRRYDTANGLAGDLKRHLDNEPVLARPPSTAYRFQKAVRRNRLAFAACAAIAASLVIGIAASAWQAVRADHEAKRAVAALDELRATAPAFAEQARGLVDRDRFDEALEKLAYAVKLRPDAPEYLIARGDVLQCQFRLAEAAAAYRAALVLHPGDARAKASAALCDELLAEPPGKDGQLTRESLSKLHLAMQEQQRPAAELMPVARRLGEEKKLVIAYWLARLKDLPISADRPLEKRLTLRDDGLLALDVSDTKIADLAPLAGMPLGGLYLNGCDQMVNFAPLSEFHALRLLNLRSTQIEDLSPLRGLPLDELEISDTRIFDISALRGMKLKKLQLNQTRVADLSPLAGMPLADFEAATIPAADYSPLAGAPLRSCVIQNSPLRDLSFLRDSPVKELTLFGCNEARGFAVLAGLKSLDLLILPQNFRELPEEELTAIGALRTHPTLRNIQTEFGEGTTMIKTTQSKDVFWLDWDREQTFVPAVRKSGFKFYLKKLPAGTYYLIIRDRTFSDLSILKGAPISELILSECKISDLAPIHDLPLRVLDIDGSPLADLSPLRGMPLEDLSINETKVDDLSPLAGLRLKRLSLLNCESLTDVSALAEIPTLERLTVPLQARNVEVLRKLPNLKWLAYSDRASNPDFPASTVEEFWKDLAANGWLARLRESGFKVQTLKQLPGGVWEVNLNDSAITDLSILKGAPIGSLSLGNTAVSDLTPLRGMPLTRLAVWDTKVRDLSPLRGMPIKELNLGKTGVTDLSPLRGMPLAHLRLHDCADLIDLSPLADCKELVTLTLPPNAKTFEFLRAIPRIDRLGYKEDPNKGYRPDQTATEFWAEYAQQDWLRALQASGFRINMLVQLPDHTWEVNLDHSAISDLSILRGAPISNLSLGDTAVADLKPLRGMPLKRLMLWVTKVTDVSPLKGMRLQELQLQETKVADLSALRGMPLTELWLHHCTEIIDLSAIEGAATLKLVTLPPNAKKIEFLRAFKLEELSYEINSNFRPDKTAAKFWQEYDTKQK